MNDQQTKRKRTLFNHYGFSLLIFFISVVVLVFVLNWQIQNVNDEADRALIVGEALAKALEYLFVGGAYLSLVVLFDYFFISRRVKQTERINENAIAVAIYFAGVFIGLGYCLGSTI